MVPGSRTHGSGGTTRLHPHPTMKNHHSSPHRGCRGPACLAFEMYTAGIFAASPSNHSSALPSFFTRKGPPLSAVIVAQGNVLVLHAQRPAAPARGGGAWSARSTRRHGHSRHPPQRTHSPPRAHSPQRTHSPPRAHSPQRTHSPPRALTSRRHGHTCRHGHSRHASTDALAATGTHVTPQRTHSPPRALTSRPNGHTRHHGHSRHAATGTLAATGTHVTPQRTHSPPQAHPLYWIVTDTSCVCPLRSIVMVTVSPAR